jgi:hypothetical protein
MRVCVCVFVFVCVCAYAPMHIPVAGSVASSLAPIITVALTFRASAPSRATHTSEPGSSSLTSMLVDVRFIRTAKKE